MKYAFTHWRHPFIGRWRRQHVHLERPSVAVELLRLAVCLAFIAGLFAIYVGMLRGIV